MVTFDKKVNTYWARRVASDYYFLLGLVFSDHKGNEEEIEVIELHPKGSDSSSIKISKEEVVRQVKNGLQKFNAQMKTNYWVSQVSYPPSEYCSYLPIIYDSLTHQIVCYYHQKEKFQESQETKEE